MTRVVACCRASRLAVLASVMLLALATEARAQRITGELSGTVTDAQGGVVPGADVALANEASGATRRTETNRSGFFAFAAIPAGTYTLTVKMPGFKTYEVTGIVLQGGDSRTVRTITLELATVAETVSVSAEVALTPLNSGEKAATLTGEEIRTMPVVGTSAAEVLRILPGMTPLTRGNDTNRPSFTGEVYGINGSGEYTGGWYNNQSANGNFTANGGRLGVDLTIDGASGNDPGCDNCATSVNPNTEFVQEVKVLQANFGAEHAKGPVALSFVSKQGGRDFHGTLFGQLRDYHLNSNEWYANKMGAERSKNVFFYPGFTLSGPLLVPGTGFNRGRDRVFFFLGFEYFRQRLDTSWTRSWVPTEAMRNGDFSQAASLGLTGAYVNTVPNFPGGIVPQDVWDPGGKILLNLFPLPNADPLQTDGYNYVNRFLNDQNGWQALARVDANLSETTKLYVRYNMQRERQPFKNSLWGRWADYQTPYPSPMHGDNRSDSVTVGLTHVFDPSLTSETLFSLTYIDFENVFDNPDAASREGVGYPYGGVFGEGWQVPGVISGWYGPYGPMYINFGGFDPVLYAKKWQWGVQENITKVWGAHTAKAGVFFEQVINKQPGSNNDNGYMGHAGWAPNSTGNTFADLLLGNVTYYYESQRNVLHDTAYQRIEGYLQDSWKVRPRVTVDAGVRIAWVGPGYDRGGQGIVTWDESLYSPTAPASDFPGLVWHAKDPSVPTGGVSKPVFLTPRVGFAWDVAGTGATVVRGGFGVYRYADAPGNYGGMLDLAYGVQQYETYFTTLQRLESLGGGDVIFGGTAIDRADDQQPRTLSWSLTLDRKLPWSTDLEIGYVGSKSDRQMNWGLAEYNPVPLGAMLDNPYDPNVNAYRPMPNYGSLKVFRHSAYQNYHALQALLSRQRGRFNFTASYTFSKNLGLKGADPNGYGYDTTNASEYAFDPREYYYGVLGTDRTHVASLSWSLQLPDVKRGGFWQALLGNWQLAGVSSYISGAPLMGWFYMQGTTVGGVPIGNLPITGSPNVYVMPVLTCDPRDDVPDGYLFNPACFAAPTPGANGSARQPYIKGQPYYGNDLSLAKSFPMGKGSRLQLRIAAFNVFNHPIRYPDTTRNLTLVFDNGVQTNADFGQLPDDNKYGRRIVQLSARFEF